MPRELVGARELKTRLGTYLQRVREGRTMVVTDRGEPVAELRPLPSDRSIPPALLRLSTKGTVTLPSRDRLPAFRAIRSRGTLLADAVSEDREDRF
jgi:prevent-host-death family protein